MLAITIMAATILFAQAGEGRATSQYTTALDTTAQIAHGKRVYAAQRCRVCHSIAGDGNRRYPLDGIGSRLTAEDIRKWIVAPQEMNPKVRKRAYDKLPPADLEALILYLQCLKQQ